MKRKIFLSLLVFAVCGVVLVLSAPALVRYSARGLTYSDVATIPHRQVGLVLGCSRHLRDGSDNPYFVSRIGAAVALFRAGKVDYLLVSGDNGRRSYDEATDMRNGLMQAGIPSEKIYCDCAGFRTLDSIVRAHEVFGLSQLTVISQEFHNQRAIFIARHRGVDAIGFNAPDVDLGDVAGIHKREKFAKIKAALDVYILRTRPHFLGGKISVGVDAPVVCSAAQ